MYNILIPEPQEKEEEMVGAAAGPISSFKEKLESWHTSPDGEHYCPCCWRKYLKQFSKGDRSIVEQNSMPTAEAIGHDDMFVFCCRCGDQVTK